jgi:hypothetical protein
MGKNMSGIQPSSLSREELLRYGRLLNNDGLPKDWCDAILHALESALDELTAPVESEQ